MADPRVVVARSCGKTQHSSRKAARAAARPIREYAVRKGLGTSTDVYRCKTCPGDVWHVTTGGRSGARR